eukprot:TRINITY_DN2441_c0_g1_i6.p1 TRINITY_DN2441_c0_g1~~TRINITY_DN2441_c0_g1_i6.p1  ORF type:complete len:308 (+),score=36.70 TRINITY_DN2441_c0_g1_i6:184-1107(+)
MNSQLPNPNLQKQVSLKDVTLKFPFSFLIQFVPPFVQNDIDRTLSCMLVCGLIITILINTTTMLITTMAFMDDQSFPKTTLPSFIVFPLLLYYVSKTGDAHKVFMIVVFIFTFLINFLRAWWCGFPLAVSSPIRILPILASLMTHKKLIFVLFFLALFSWTYFYISTPFPYTYENCSTFEDLNKLKLFLGVNVVFTLTVVGMLFSEIKRLKNTILLMEMKRASAAAQLYTEFTRNISHEIRTPLFTIIGLVELMLDDPRIQNKAYKETLQNVFTASDELNTLLSSVLDWSNPSSSYCTPLRKYNPNY